MPPEAPVTSATLPRSFSDMTAPFEDILVSGAEAGNRQRPRWLWPRAAYLHVPFCAHHCGYCDFAIAVGQEARIDEYVEAVEREIALALTEQGPQPLDTLYL